MLVFQSSRMAFGFSNIRCGSSGGQLAPTLLSIIITAQSELHGRLARPHENLGRLATDIRG